MFTSNTSRYADGLILVGERFDRTYGLDWYDFAARQYDAAAPWFTSIDPLAEDFTWLTPYNYCAGDPVNCVDPDGREVKPNSQVEYDMILHTLPDNDRKYVQLDKNGCIDKNLLKNAKVTVIM